MKNLIKRYCCQLVWFVLILISLAITKLAYAEEVVTSSLQSKLAQLETSSGGRIGVTAVDTSNNMQLQYRANERFPMACTAKVIGVSAILKQSMTDASFLEQRVKYNKQDLTEWSPITQKHTADGMTVKELCSAAISYSDNTAMNLLIKQLGSLNKMNNFARSLGDSVSREDDLWPCVITTGNASIIRNSSTPFAMENNLQQLVLGDVLSPHQRSLLITWLKNTTTGYARIRAGVPKGWIVGDKTGSGSYGTTNDIAVIWPPHCAPIVLAVYFAKDQKDAPRRNDIVAATTRIVLEEFSRSDQCLSKQMAV